MVREIWVHSQVASYQILLKWYLIPPCLTLNNIRYVSRVKWSNPGKGVALSPTPRCSSYWKRSLLVALDYGRQLYFPYSSASGYKKISERPEVSPPYTTDAVKVKGRDWYNSREKMNNCLPVRVGASIRRPVNYHLWESRGQDVTQGQFLYGVKLAWIQSFSSLRLVALRRFKTSVWPSMIHALPKSISTNWNANGFVQELNFDYRFHSIQW